MIYFHKVLITCFQLFFYCNVLQLFVFFLTWCINVISLYCGNLTKIYNSINSLLSSCICAPNNIHFDLKLNLLLFSDGIICSMAPIWHSPLLCKIQQWIFVIVCLWYNHALIFHINLKCHQGFAILVNQISWYCCYK